MACTKANTVPIDNQGNCGCAPGYIPDSQGNCSPFDYSQATGTPAGIDDNGSAAWKDKLNQFGPALLAAFAAWWGSRQDPKPDGTPTTPAPAPTGGGSGLPWWVWVVIAVVVLVIVLAVVRSRQMPTVIKT